MSSEKHPDKLAAELPPPAVSKTRRSSKRIWWACGLLLAYGIVKLGALHCAHSDKYVSQVLGEQRWAYDAFTEGSDAKKPLSPAEAEKLYL